MKKTNAVRLLEQAKIPYTIREFEIVGENWHGVEIAKLLNMEAEKVFKTLVTKGDKNGFNIFCIPINCELNLKKAATVSKNKSIEMIAMKDMLSVTGYIRGACSPIGMKKKFPTYIDETAMLFDEIGVSAGQRACQIVLNPESLCEFVSASFEDLT